MSLRERLASGGFAVTAEISPPRGASTEKITATAALLRDWVDAVNVTDNQGSNVRLASWAGSLAVLAAGLEPVMQMTCRDRNRIALQSDLLGASDLLQAAAPLTPGRAESAPVTETYKPGQIVPRDGTVECGRHRDVQNHVKAGTRFAPCSHHHEHSEGCTWQYV